MSRIGGLRRLLVPSGKHQEGAGVHLHIIRFRGRRRANLGGTGEATEKETPGASAQSSQTTGRSTVGTRA